MEKTKTQSCPSTSSTFSAEVQLKRYFEARGVPSVPNTAESYLQMCHTLMDAAEDGGEVGEVETHHILWTL